MRMLLGFLAGFIHTSYPSGLYRDARGPGDQRSQGVASTLQAMQYVYGTILRRPFTNASNIIAVHSVMVGSHQAEFVHHDPLSSLHTSKSDDCHTHPELKRKLFSALAEGDEGELSIGIPKEIVIKPSGNTAAGIASEGASVRLLALVDVDFALHISFG